MAYQYLNFGTAGIVAEMFVLGMLNEFLSRKARSQFTSNFFRVVYVFYISYVLLILWKNGLANAVNFAEVSLIELWGITWSVALVRRKIATISKKGLGTGRTERPPSLFWTDKAFPERSAIDG